MTWTLDAMSGLKTAQEYQTRWTRWGNGERVTTKQIQTPSQVSLT